MKTDHIIEALRVTAREYAALPNGQLIAQALRGVVARAQRYEAQDEHPGQNACLQCGGPKQSDKWRCDSCIESD